MLSRNHCNSQKTNCIFVSRDLKSFNQQFCLQLTDLVSFLESRKRAKYSFEREINLFQYAFTKLTRNLNQYLIILRFFILYTHEPRILGCTLLSFMHVYSFIITPMKQDNFCLKQATGNGEVSALQLKPSRNTLVRKHLITLLA